MMKWWNITLSGRTCACCTVSAWQLMRTHSLAFALHSCSCSTVSSRRWICARCLSFACCTVSAWQLMHTRFLVFSPHSCAPCTDSARFPACSHGHVAGGGSLSSLDVGVAIAPSAEERLTQLGRLWYVTDKQTNRYGHLGPAQTIDSDYLPLI